MLLTVALVATAILVVTVSPAFATRCGGGGPPGDCSDTGKPTLLVGEKQKPLKPYQERCKPSESFPC